jgi:hypothetical protein
LPGKFIGVPPRTPLLFEKSGQKLSYFGALRRKYTGSRKSPVGARPYAIALPETGIMLLLAIRYATMKSIIQGDLSKICKLMMISVP